MVRTKLSDEERKARRRESAQRYREAHREKARESYRNYQRRKNGYAPRKPALAPEEAKQRHRENGKERYARLSQDPEWREQHRQKARAFHAAHRAEIRIKDRARLTNLRQQVLDAYGNKCVRCGFDDPRALQMDHVNGGGTRIRKKRKYMASFYREFLAKQETGEFQLLCANCNWIKRHENKEFGVWI